MTCTPLHPELASYPSTTSRTILFAEDDDSLREVTCRFLQMMKFSVVPCGDAEIAARRFRAMPRVDMLLTDLQMPGRTGLELARDLTGLVPALPVLIVTGSILPRESLSEVRDRRWTVLSKPCGLPSLLSTIEALLSQHPIPSA